MALDARNLPGSLHQLKCLHAESSIISTVSAGSWLTPWAQQSHCIVPCLIVDHAKIFLDDITSLAPA